jgi:hypothetical protein
MEQLFSCAKWEWRVSNVQGKSGHPRDDWAKKGSPKRANNDNIKEESTKIL